MSDNSIGTISNVSLAHLAAVPAPAEFASLSPDSLLFFCQSRLQELDQQILKKMKGQEGLIGLRSQAESILNDIKSRNEGKQFDDKGFVDATSLKLDKAIEGAKATNNAPLLESLCKAKQILNHANDGIVNDSEIASIDGLLKAAVGSCGSAAEMSMIELQSLVSRRATQLQLTTGMMSSVSEGSKAIAANIGR